MTSRKTSLPLIAGAAAVIGISGSAIVLVTAFACGEGGIPASLAPMLAIAPLSTSLLAALFIYKKLIAPQHKKLEETITLAQRTLASGRSLQTSTPLDEIAAVNLSVQALAEQVRETRKREKSVIENAADVICVIDIDAKLLQVNAAAKSIWGYTPDEITGKQLSDFLVREDVDNTLQNVLGAEKSIDRIFFENRFRKKSGEVIDLLWSAHWSVSDGGLFCVAHDITERKRTEQLLKESEERIRGILEYLPAAVLVVNRSGLIEFINATGSRLAGYKSDQIRGMRASEILSFCREPFIPRQLDDLISKTSGFDSQIMKENGERFPAEVSLTRFQLSGEKCYLVIFLDVTHKHAIEMAKREFVTMVSHDLRTPLTSILSILSYLEAGHGGQLNEKGASLTCRARKESERLICLIRDLLDLEKMKAGKFSMHFAEAEVKDIANSALEAVERFAELHKVKVIAKIPEGLHCHCDGARVIQVLVNLLDNAIKFSPPDESVIIDAESSKDQICISVSNKGRGIPANKLSTIFERFEQVEESDAVEKKGTGLGLAICKTIVEQHAGKMWVASTRETGTKFSFTLRLEAWDADEERTQELEQPGQSTP